ncbi:hypothetical protein K7432_014188 [Basidiobolus ranarum]|uniref:Homeobox domain-containing protein n=1 Tax=Basidiobolus ranarum TaxID=34480 RepID=A0ABR2WHY6_9FUNG
MTPRAVQVWFQNKRQSWKSTRGKNPNSKRSTSPCAIQNLQTTRFNSPNLSPPLSNERLVANRTPLLDSDLPLTPPKKRRFSVEIGLEATVLRHQSPSLPGTNSSQQSTYLEPLAPLRTLSTVAPQQFLEIAPNSFPRSCKLPSLMEMGIDFRSSVRGSF